ncbi:MAG: hypothetical protein HKN68_15710 [Saprospiraceae bacterium]|nr:hypothetical protein [Saprospiraceae bacterium]
MNIQEYIEIAAPASRIFQYLVDVDNRIDYVPALKEVVMIDPLPIREGSRYIEVATIGGKELSTTYRVTHFIENKRLSATTEKSVFPISVDLLIDDKEGRSLLLINMNLKLSGLFKIASPIVKGIVAGQARGILNKLKANIENKI